MSADMTDDGLPPRPEQDRLVTITCLDRDGRQIGVVEVPKGTVLLRALEPLGFVAGSCGGNGACGWCAVELEDGRVVQSCFIRVQTDLTVRRLRFK